MLEEKTRYLQIAINSDVSVAMRILPYIPSSDRILIEAGTPFIKKEGMKGIRLIASMWSGRIVADLKTADGAVEEVINAYRAGATAATVLGSAPIETINFFIAQCNKLRMDSMIDMLGVEEPIHVLRKLRVLPSVIILHKGRDEETTRGKVIAYKQVNKIRSKYGVLISAAGGVDLREARSAIFNGANIVVVNTVASDSPWTGIDYNADIAEITQQFLETIE
jgi:bifunctional enzyme Fae/Hps